MAVGTTASIGLAGCNEDSQSSADQSGEQAAEQVTNRLVEVNTVGTVENGEITEVNITMRLAAGSGDVDLEGVTIQWVTADSSRNLVAAGREDASAADGVFSYAASDDDDTSISADGTLNSSDDRATITIGLDGSPSGSLNAPLEAGQSVTLTVTTLTGGETTLALAVPDTLSGNDSVEL